MMIEFSSSAHLRDNLGPRIASQLGSSCLGRFESVQIALLRSPPLRKPSEVVAFKILKQFYSQSNSDEFEIVTGYEAFPYNAI
jgi:hypothetical protein